MNASTLSALLAALAMSAPACAQPVMTAPAFVVGDRWQYRESDLMTKLETGQLSESVTAADAAEYWIDARRTGRTWWRGDAVKRVHREQFLYSEAAADQRGKSIATNDGGCAYPWPLKVGSEFECLETATFPNGWKVRYEMKFSVEGAESVETPAGRFDTLRLVAKGYANNDTTNNRSRHERIVWLAPAVKREVRHEIRTFLRNNQIFKVEGRELVAFTAGAS
jgi:hypothetical protein